MQLLAFLILVLQKRCYSVWVQSITQRWKIKEVTVLYFIAGNQCDPVSLYLVYVQSRASEMGPQTASIPLKHLTHNLHLFNFCLKIIYSFHGVKINWCVLCNPNSADFCQENKLSKSIKWWHFIFHFQDPFTGLFFSSHLCCAPCHPMSP